MYVADVVRAAYKLGCFMCTIYMIILLLNKYFANEDSSIITIKSFKQSHGNTFPAVTICLRSPSSTASLYNNEYILSNLGVTGLQFKDAMMGIDSRFNSTVLTKLNFELATIKLPSYLKRFQIQDTNNNKVITWKNDGNYNLSSTINTTPMRLYYQDPTIICYSYQTKIDPNTTVDSLDLYFYIAKLQTISRGKLLIYVHYNRQLIRNMRFLHYIRDFNGIGHDESNNLLTLDLNYISVMRNREDANDPCNETLQDDDKEWMQRVVRKFGCVPPYWKIFRVGGAPNNSIECNTNEQLKSISRYLPRDNEFITKTIFRRYHPPCYRMRVLANSNVDRYKKPELLKIKFRFRLS